MLRPSPSSQLSRQSFQKVNSDHNTPSTVWFYLFLFNSLLVLLFSGLFAWAFIEWKSDSSQEKEPCLSQQDIEKAHSAWGDALVAIGNTWFYPYHDASAFYYVGHALNASGALLAAQNAFDAAYTEPLLFKPTVSYAPYTFRNSRNETLSYFVGKAANVRYGNDLGFALGFIPGIDENNLTWMGYNKVYFHDFQYLLNGDFCHVAVAQGKVTVTSRLTGKNGTVDKTFVYTRGNGGLRARISVHHSSMEIPVPPLGSDDYWKTFMIKDKLPPPSSPPLSPSLSPPPSSPLP